uniref:Uncharacterized protein LOC104248812 n=1 Tax=Nicotiana sylvestris TaxID=4096 RepID=A0A1U7YXI2_NICSY|nr:PREDICTED: uncharacterized protein LOC104248812 [Nicotiana sylvestris]
MAKNAAFTHLYDELECKGKDKMLYRLAKGDRHIVLGELEHSESWRDFGYYRRITVKEVEGVMHVEVKLDAQVIPKRASFKYLRSIIQGNGEIDEDVAHHIRAGWMKWRLAFCVLCDRNMPLRLKEDESRRDEMFRWMCGCTRRDRIKNEVIWDSVGVASVEDKMGESGLRWFGHVKRRSIDAPVRRCQRLALESLRRGRGASIAAGSIWAGASTDVVSTWLASTGSIGLERVGIPVSASKFMGASTTGEGKS